MINIGSFYMTCGVTNTKITDGKPCYGFLVMQKLPQYAKNVYYNDNFDLLPVAIKGTYDDYGRIAIDIGEEEYLEHCSKVAKKYLKFQLKDDPVEFEELQDLYENCGYTNDGGGIWGGLMGLAEREEDIRMSVNKRYSYHGPQRLHMLFVSGNFIEKLTKSFRTNPYAEREKVNPVMPEMTFEKDMNSFFNSGKFNEKFEIVSKLKRFYIESGTPVLPSNYGSQQVNLAVLKMMSEFYEEELNDQFDPEYYCDYDDDNNEIPKKLSDVLHEQLGGTHCDYKDGEYSYKDY